MAKEIEVKILDIDPVKIRAKLLDNGAVLQRKLSKQKRYVFDIQPGDKSKWIRLRDTGDKITLAVKVINSSEIDGTEEYETEVSDIDTTLKMLEKMGFRPKSYQENFREDYQLADCSISIDFWPKLQPYLEIEGSSKESVEKCQSLLGLKENTSTSENTTELYKRQGINLDDIDRLIFSEDEEKLVLSKG